MKKPVVILATALSTVALAGAIGVGVAAADPTSSPSPGTSATSAASPGATPPGQQAEKTGKAGKARAKHDLTRRALHGEVTLGGAKHRVVDFQRGTVTAVSGSSLTVKSADGYSATYVVAATTKVRHAKAKAEIADVKPGDKVRVVAVKDGATLTATRVADRTK